MHAFSFTETKAAEYTASMMKKSDWTVRKWRSALIDNDGPEYFPNRSKGATNEAVFFGKTRNCDIYCCPLGPIFVLHQLPQFKLCCSLKNSCVTIEIIIIITIASRFNNDKLADV